MKYDLDNRTVPDNPRYDRPMHEFFNNIPLEEFTVALALQDDERLKDFHQSITDPRNARLTLVTLCRRHEVTLTDLQKVWREHQVNLGLMGMANHAPRVMENIATDAASYNDICPTCRGKGKIFSKAKSFCPRCAGHGVVKRPGDLESRHIMMEALGVTGKASLVTTINTLSASFGPEHGMEKIIEMVQPRPEMGEQSEQETKS